MDPAVQTPDAWTCPIQCPDGTDSEIAFDIFDITNPNTAIQSLSDGDAWTYCAHDADFDIHIYSTLPGYDIVDPERSLTRFPSPFATPYTFADPVIQYHHHNDTTQSGILILEYELYNTNGQKYCRDGIAELDVALPSVSCTNATSTGGPAECGSYPVSECVTDLDCGSCTTPDICDDGSCSCTPETCTTL